MKGLVLRLQLPGQPKAKPRLSGQLRAGLPGCCSAVYSVTSLPSALDSREAASPLLLPPIPTGIGTVQQSQMDTAPHIKVFIFLNTNKAILLKLQLLAGPQNHSQPFCQVYLGLYHLSVLLALLPGLGEVKARGV